ncbi:DUF1304 domain-containing protein [Amycolatopsis sp. NPDC059657]|uniref:DUF1304 domain-containing protein n=1 Tax=Amycolatopsis sp. NPDC059657 TaxID=3346899 RepID=UPI00366D1A27
MNVVANILVGLVVLIHLYIVVLEMFLWTSKGPKAFGVTPEFAKESASLAANQGLYNGFLALALIWGLIATGSTGFQFKLYGLICVIVAGIYGAITASKKILFVQVVPGTLALVAVLLAG